MKRITDEKISSAIIDSQAKIAFNRPVAEATFLMGLCAPRIAAGACPGQFVMVRTENATDPLLRRPFSISGTRHGDLILILYKVVGQGTARMAAMAAGDHLPVMGPLGRGFRAPRPQRKPVLVAGGIGIAPLIFLAATLRSQHPVFLAGYRQAAELISPADVTPGIVPPLTATDDGSAGYHGLVTELLKTQLDGQSGETLQVYACGPPAMLKQVALLTAERHISCQVSLESVMACGLGACQGCALKSSDRDHVNYYLACKDGPVFPAHAVDWGQHECC